MKKSELQQLIKEEIVKALNENSEGDYEYMLYSLFSDENNIKQKFPNSKIIKIDDGIKIEFPESYYIDEGFDDDPIAEGWGVFDSLKILTQINPFEQQTKFQYNIYIETEPEEAINYTDSIQGGNSISNLKILHTWLDSIEPASKYYDDYYK
jgi:hypothetical protein